MARPGRVVYFASPIDLFTHACYGGVLRLVEAAFPGWQIIEPRRQAWTNNAEWREAWPSLCLTLSALAVWPRTEDGSIGYGCLTELRSMFAQSTPVYLVTLAGGVQPITKIAVQEVAGIDTRRENWRIAEFIRLPKARAGRKAMRP
jgi:hypothetical protein